MKYLMVENKGEVDVMSFVLMGASTKRGNEQQIGQFGTGSNHAIAWALRNNLNCIVFSGEERFDFITADVVMRNKTFKRVVVEVTKNEYSRIEPTSFTTELGELDWTAWKCIREFMCNAIDEGDERIFNRVEDVRGTVGRTKVYLELNSSLITVLDEWDKYFLTERGDAIFINEHGAIYPNLYPSKTLIYRKGILVFEEEKPAMFSYELEKIDITEDRVLKDTSRAFTEISLLIAECDSGRVISSILNADANETDTFETKRTNFDSWFAPRKCKFSSIWMERLNERKILIRNRDEMRAQRLPVGDYIMLSDNLGNALKKYFKLVTEQQEDEYEELALNDDIMLKVKLDNIVAKMAQMNIDVTDRLVPCNFYKKDIGIMTSPKGDLFISENLIEQSPDDIEIFLYKKHLKKEFLKNNHSMGDLIRTMLGDDVAFAQFLVGKLYKEHCKKY